MQDPGWLTVSVEHFSWLESATPYEFVLENVEGWADSEPGDFRRIRIILPDNREFILVDSGGFVKITDHLHRRLAEKNLAESSYLYFSPDLRQTGEGPPLFLFGYAYASSPGMVYIIQPDSSGYPHVLFSQEFEIADITDIDMDGINELVGNKQYAERFGPNYCFQTYTPYSVFKLHQDDMSQLGYSLQLSKRYNLSHYFGWAGPDYTMDYVVVHCLSDSSEPVLMKREDALRLFDQ